MLTEFVVEDVGAPPSLDEMSAALSARVESRHSERRSWLDTFDWRLHRAGLRLEHHRRRSGQAAFVLTDLDGQRQATVPAPRNDEVTAADIPAGPIQERVSGLAGIRALLVRAVVDGSVVVLSVRNADDKTVARVSVEGPLTSGGDSLPARIRIEPLRGYDKSARRVAKRLAAWPGLRTADAPLFVAVCASQGIRPGVYRAKPETTLDPTMPARLAFAARPRIASLRAALARGRRALVATPTRLASGRRSRSGSSSGVLTGAACPVADATGQRTTVAAATPLTRRSRRRCMPPTRGRAHWTG